MASFVLLLCGLVACASAWEFQNDEACEIEIVNLEKDNPVLGGCIRKKCRGKSGKDWETKWLYPNYYFYNGPVIKVDELKLSDAGTYECIGINRRTGNKTTTWFQIDFPERLETVEIVKMDDERSEYDGNIRRECIFNGIGWRTSWILPNGTDTHYSYLVIPKAIRRQRGRYTCIARDLETNKVVTGWIIFRFLRSLKLRVEISTLRENKIVIGGTLALKCQASSPDWIVHWVKADGIRVYYYELVVNNLRFHHLGRYWCILRNRYTGRNVKISYNLR